MRIDNLEPQRRPRRGSRWDSILATLLGVPILLGFLAAVLVQSATGALCATIALAAAVIAVAIDQVAEAIESRGD